jgi:hypothetical protein
MDAAFLSDSLNSLVHAATPRGDATAVRGQAIEAINV